MYNQAKHYTKKMTKVQFSIFPFFRLRILDCSIIRHEEVTNHFVPRNDVIPKNAKRKKNDSIRHKKKIAKKKK